MQYRHRKPSPSTTPLGMLFMLRMFDLDVDVLSMKERELQDSYRTLLITTDFLMEEDVLGVSAKIASNSDAEGRSSW